MFGDNARMTLLLEQTAGKFLEGAGNILSNELARQALSGDNWQSRIAPRIGAGQRELGRRYKLAIDECASAMFRTFARYSGTIARDIADATSSAIAPTNASPAQGEEGNTKSYLARCSTIVVA